MKIEVINFSYTEVTREPDPNDRWDAGCRDTQNDIRGIRISKDEQYFDIDTEFPIVAGREYYLLYAEYSTGNSFGSDGGIISFILLYETLSKAIIAREILEKAKDYSAEITTEDGNTLTYSIPWIGYFERLEMVD